MTNYEELDIAGRLDALDEGKDPRRDPPDAHADEAMCCPRCGDLLPLDEELVVVWAEAMCRKCLLARKPEIGELVEALAECQRVLGEIEKVQAVGSISAYAVALGSCQGKATGLLAKLKELGV